MGSAVLIIHTSCVFATTAIDEEINLDVGGGLKTATHGFDWKPEFSPLTCEFVIIPEIPVLKNHESAVMSSFGRENQAANDAFDDSETWKEVLSYEPSQYEKRSHRRLNPCGMDNLVILNDLLPSLEGPNYLLSLESCYVDDVDDLNAKVGGVESRQRLPVQATPSSFAFALEELISLDALMSSSPTDIMGFAELNITFDFTILNHILREREALSRPSLMEHTRATNDSHQDVWMTLMEHAEVPQDGCKEMGSQEHEHPNKFSPIEQQSVSWPTPADCLCECTQQSSEFPLLFLKTMIEKEASDFQRILLIQAGIGVLISILFIWIGTRTLNTQSRVRLTSTTRSLAPVGAAEVQNIQYRLQESSSDARTGPTYSPDHLGLINCYISAHRESSELVPSLVDQSPCCKVKPPTPLHAKQIALVTPQRRTAERPHFVRMYAQFDDSIPEDDDDKPACVDLKDEDSRYDTPTQADQMSNDSPASSADGNETPCSQWACRWLQNQALRQQLRRHKRQVRKNEGRPMFITPVANECDCLKPLVSAAATSNEGHKDHDEATDHDVFEIYRDETSAMHLQGGSFIRDYWGH